MDASIFDSVPAAFVLVFGSALNGRICVPELRLNDLASILADAVFEDLTTWIVALAG